MWINFVNSVDPNIASFRYRSVWLSQALCERGERCLITDAPEAVDFGLSTKGITFTKTFTQRTLSIAQQAATNGVPVVLDICDNIFVPDYLGGSKGLDLVKHFAAMAELASAITVPTEALKSTVHARLPAANAAVLTVVDPVESQDDVRHLTKVLGGNTDQGARFELAPNLVAVRRGRPQIANRAIVKEHTTRFFDRIKKLASPGPRSGKRVLWFGNAGQAHGDYGIATVLRFRQALQRIHRETPIELTIVSNDRAKYRQFIQALPLPTRYVDWDPIGVFDQIAAADVVILPNSKDEFSRTKSANRAVMALAAGTPVVAEYLEALEPLRSALVMDDLYLGLKRYLLEDNSAADLELAATIIENHYSRRVVGQQLLQILNDAAGRHVRPLTSAVTSELAPSAV